MFQKFYEASTLLTWPLVGLVLFVISFAAVLAYAVWGLGGRDRIERLSRLPLEGETGAVDDQLERRTD